jgi:hypothetical protein
MGLHEGTKIHGDAAFHCLLEPFTKLETESWSELLWKQFPEWVQPWKGREERRNCGPISRHMGT